MVFSSQFSLSLELTRLLPLQTVASKATAAIMSLARDLQNSGSDIVIEEDLAEIFGRCRIADNMASSFRSAISKSEPLYNLCAGIELQHGPGPTVIRSLATQQQIYFATVLQCSFLSSLYTTTSLAEALAQAFEYRFKGAPEDFSTRAPPSRQGIAAFLRVCSEQTADYQWDLLYLSVARHIGRAEEAVADPIPPVIMRGALQMFPLVQTLPLDRKVEIVATDGICALVIWAHNILGLTVVVTNLGIATDPTMPPEVKFGGGSEQVIIRAADVYSSVKNEGYNEMKTSITLLEASNQQNLFTLEPEDTDRQLESSYKVRMKGYGRRILSDAVDLHQIQSGKEAVLQEMIRTSCGIALAISRPLETSSRCVIAKELEDRVELFQSLKDGEMFVNSTGSENDAGSIKSFDASEHGYNDRMEHEIEFPVGEGALLKAASLLFKENKLDEISIREFATLYTPSKINGSPVMLPSFFNNILQTTSADVAWQYLLTEAERLAILLIAISSIRELDSSPDLPLCYKINLLDQHPLYQQLLCWNGKAPLWLPEDSSFQALGLLMVGHTMHLDDSLLSQTSLISDRGWSLFMSSYGISNPSHTDSGGLVVKKGVPTRNGVRKHRIVDGRREIHEGIRGNRFEGQQIFNESIDVSKCTLRTKFLDAWCGELGDSFVVTLRILTLSPVPTERLDFVRETGYRELFLANWSVRPTRTCQHSVHEMSTLKLQAGCAARDFITDHELTTHLQKHRVVVVITANNPAARWQTLAAIARERQHAHYESYAYKRMILLRDSDCCYQCALDQCLQMDYQYHYLIL
ncbi:hypothetical protein BKA65DRAFT_498851 [Rhexocercosporidium sp. MPI-PUGE-AT-0058]|nr:hypothetical protein BKA65DRAFT_498851 [Rhexocercosporidium sp. MPI-PUGE-AT-0058]